MITRRCVALALICLVAVAAWADEPNPERATADARCTRVVDGDTLILRGGERVRLLGIDAPELGERYADEAKWALYEWVMRRTILLEFDVRERDVYGRLLAHIYVETDDGEWVLVNEELVRQGWARLLFIPPNGLYRTTFETALQEAQLQRRGIWGTIDGCLSVAALEADLVALMTEMVTVRFAVGAVVLMRGDWAVYAAESQFGFYVRIPEDLSSSMPWQGPEALVGTCLLVTGILGCERVGQGPSIRLEYPDQVGWPCPDEG